MHTFTTHNVSIDKDLANRLVTVRGHNMWTKRFTETKWANGQEVKTQKQRIWNCSDSKFLSNADGNALINAVGLAYNRHLGLSLTPDAVWSAIAHGFSVWINENAEAVRGKFVSHTGKVKLIVDINPGEATDPSWNRIMREFSDKIADHIGNKRNLFVNDFSTTTTDSRIGSEALLMYGMAKYFDYGMRTLCGFPKITIEGNPEDWEKIVDRIRAMSEYALGDDDHLKKWTGKLLPVAEQFVQASKGNPELDFWRGLYQEDGGSGGPYISGHVLNLFPYLKSGNNIVPNSFDHKRGPFNGPTSDRFLRCYSPVDVEWEDTSALRDMKFNGGVVGVSLDEDTVRPEVGWCVSEEMK